MSFLLGLLVGAVVFGGDQSELTPQQKSLLGQIPIRCLGLIEIDVQQYRECRTPSMTKELTDKDNWRSNYAMVKPLCSRWEEYDPCILRNLFNKNMDWEIKSLQALAATAKAQNAK